MTVHPCISFLLIQNNQILLEQRSLQKSMDAGLVAIPGGHMEPGESQQQTLQREVQEELGVVANGSEYLCSLYHPTGELQLIHYYVVTQWTGELQALEAASVFWCDLAKAAECVDIGADKTALAEYQRLRAVLSL